MCVCGLCDLKFGVVVIDLRVSGLDTQHNLNVVELSRFCIGRGE